MTQIEYRCSECGELVDSSDMDAVAACTTHPSATIDSCPAQTKAEQIAASFGDDGGGRGDEIAEACMVAGATRSPTVNMTTRYTLSDGSAIVVQEGVWDLGFTGCDCTCWDSDGGLDAHTHAEDCRYAE